jgi:hypothetical protein
MRIAGLIVASVLVAGCSHSVGGDAERTTPSLTVPPSSTRAAPSTTSPTTTTLAKPPGQGAPIGDVVAWVEAGKAADPGSYHSATRGGDTTQLGEDVAFVTPSGKANCMTDSKYSAGALACLVDLTNPPPRPDDAYGEWKGGWIDYDGKLIMVGRVKSDPERFAAGSGPELPYGQSLAFGDYRCRSDQAGLVCVNYAFQSAARFSDAGVQPFGCLKPSAPMPQVGEVFSC